MGGIRGLVARTGNNSGRGPRSGIWILASQLMAPLARRRAPILEYSNASGARPQCSGIAPRATARFQQMKLSRIWSSKLAQPSGHKKRKPGLLKKQHLLFFSV